MRLFPLLNEYMARKGKLPSCFCGIPTTEEPVLHWGIAPATM